MNGRTEGESLQDQIRPLQNTSRTATFPNNDTNGNWSERNLLSLDGGGIRGYWTLLVLAKLMEAIGDEERKQSGENDCTDSFEPVPFPENVTQHIRESSARRQDDEFSDDDERFLPCHYFDIICGSSTGSLIAIMLCKFRMPVRDCIDEYKRMSQQIFGNPRIVSQRNIGIVKWPKYKAAAMENAFKDVTRRRGQRPSANQHPSTPPQFPTARGACAMFATTKLRTKSHKGSIKTLHLIRSYDHEEKEDRQHNGEIVNFGQAAQMEIWQVARAATAAPMYFTELEYQFTSQDPANRYFFSDGGFGLTNNPTALGIQEIETAFGRDKIGVILSVGTARADTNPGKGGIFHRIKEGFSTATDPKQVANWVNYQRRENCWRLNDEIGLDLELDDWKPNGLFTAKSSRGRKTLQKITRSFNDWALDRGNQRILQMCAKELVGRRRARKLDEDRWFRYATGASPFRCRSNDCHESYGSRQRFDDHWQEFHEGQEYADRWREPLYTVWGYPPVSPSAG